MDVGKENNQPGVQARHDARRATTWRGDHAVHTEAIINAATDAGEKVYDDHGDYVGLTYDRIIELLVELKTFREGNGVKLLGAALIERTDELTALRHEVGDLRGWLIANTNIKGLREMNELETLQATRKLLDTAKSVVAACWPVLMTMWGNVVHTLTEAGIVTRGKDGY